MSRTAKEEQRRIEYIEVSKSKVKLKVEKNSRVKSSVFLYSVQQSSTE